jgi:hypothetical protein
MVMLKQKTVKQTERSKVIHGVVQQEAFVMKVKNYEYPREILRHGGLPCEYTD